jgi:hypothetical protein
MAIVADNGRCRHQRGYPHRHSCRLPARSHTGITFDATRHFGHKLQVTASHHAETTVLAIDCAGGVRAITSHAPAWRVASRWRPSRAAATAATSPPPVKPAGASSPSGQTPQ